MTWWQYLILANVYLILFYGFYALLLRRETFFQLNRFYLVGSAILSFMVPLMQADWARNLFITQRIKQTIYHLDPVVIYQIPAAPSQHLTIGQVLAIIYIGGIILLASRFILQLIVLRYNIKYNDSEDAYSFFKTIKLGDTLNNHGVIMAHEEVHARQWHSADVLLIEAIMIINWFNPAVYFYRKAIKHIHEFIADRNALKSGTSKQEYALLLLSETFKTPAHELVNPFFNHSLLKQRILMLQKNNSQRTALLKYGLSAPLFALMLILSSATIHTNQVITIINNKAEQVMMTPASPELRHVYAAVTTSSDGNKIITTVTTTPQVQEFKPSAKPAPVITDLPDTAKRSELFTAVEISPSFKGGTSALGTYLSQNIKYPEDLRRQNLQARVIVAFVVEPDGSLSNVHALNWQNTSAANEAIRVIAASPKWEPGVQNGRKVRAQYTVPISFKLQGDAEEKHVAVADSARKHTFNRVMYAYQYKNNNPAGVSSVGTISHIGPDSGRAVSTTFYRIPQSPPLLVTTATGNLLQPLYIIDGEEASLNTLKSTAAANIESVTVLKGTNATQKYGKKGENGVVEITLKKRDIKN
jgi:TonB family protein